MTNKKLFRSRKDVKVSGVCGGIAEYLGVDSTMVRIIWLLTSIFVSPVILLYFICAMIIPKEPRVVYRGPGQEEAKDTVIIEETPEPVVEENETQDGFDYESYDRSEDYDESSFYSRDDEESKEKKYRYDEFEDKPRRSSSAALWGLIIILIGVYFAVRVFVPAIPFRILLPIGLIGVGLIILIRNKDGE